MDGWKTKRKVVIWKQSLPDPGILSPPSSLLHNTPISQEMDPSYLFPRDSKLMTLYQNTKLTIWGFKYLRNYFQRLGIFCLDFNCKYYSLKYRFQLSCPVCKIESWKKMCANLKGNVFKNVQNKQPMFAKNWNFFGKIMIYFEKIWGTESINL